MSLWSLILLIALTWMSYPFAGSAGVQLEVLDGKRPKGAGFSVLPELLIFPAGFLLAALGIDYFAWPYGRWIVAGICVVQLVVHASLLLRCFLRTRR